MFLEHEQNDRAKREHNRWQSVRKPESDIMLRINHSDGTGQGTTIDQEVKVEVDTSSGGCRIYNLLFAVFVGPCMVFRLCIALR